MPRCMQCRDRFSVEALHEVGGDVVCERCLPHLPLQIRSGMSALSKLSLVKEKTMADLKKHLVASINVFEIETADGNRDHMAEVQVGIGGLNVKYDATFDQIRDFFTKRREQKPGKVKLVS